MFYNPSVLKSIDWEDLEFQILYFQLQIDISHSLIPQLRGNLVGEKMNLCAFVKD